MFRFRNITKSFILVDLISRINFFLIKKYINAAILFSNKKFNYELKI